MKFCPRCGTPRERNFCGGCGFGFPDATLQVETSVIPQTLVYGEGFDPAKHCSNCGEPKNPSTNSCRFCDA